MVMRKMWIVEERKDKTVYRRRCLIGTELISFFFASACALLLLLICIILYGTRTQNPSLPSLVKQYLPAGRCQCEFSTTFSCDTCLDCASGQMILTANETENKDEDLWTFVYSRDKNNYGLDEAQCDSAFPGQYEDIERATKVRERYGKVTEAELNSFQLTKGMVRAMIYDRELHILEANMVDNVNRQKAVACLSAIYRAILAGTTIAAIPNIEFVFSVEDLPALPTKPIWSLARRVQDHGLWLMPDFGFWSWDMPSLGTIDQVTREVVEREAEEPWDRKTEKLVWRGKINYAPKLRRALLDAAKDKPWSDVRPLKWANANSKNEFLGPVDQCDYAMIAHAEGRSYSGSLKYRQLCRSVIISHKLQWIQHYHYLLRSNGSNQNFVEVERDFSDLSFAMEDLLSHPEKAKRIADNSVQIFRERYLTQAAEACYWRRLIKKWKDVMAWEPALYSGAEHGMKGWVKGVRYETFILYEPKVQLGWPKSAH